MTLMGISTVHVNKNSLGLQIVKEFDVCVKVGGKLVERLRKGHHTS